MFGYFTGAAWKYVIEPENHRVDFKTYEFIGFQPGNAVYYARTDLAWRTRVPTSSGRAGAGSLRSNPRRTCSSASRSRCLACRTDT